MPPRHLPRVSHPPDTHHPHPPPPPNTHLRILTLTSPACCRPLTLASQAHCHLLLPPAPAHSLLSCPFFASSSRALSPPPPGCLLRAKKNKMGEKSGFKRRPPNTHLPAGDLVHSPPRRSRHLLLPPARTSAHTHLQTLTSPPPAATSHHSPPPRLSSTFISNMKLKQIN